MTTVLQKPIAQSADANNVNVFNKAALDRLVGIVFHSDRYTGRCKLYPHPDNDRARARLNQLAKSRDDCPDPKALQCCDQHPWILGFPTSEIKKDDTLDRWYCFTLHSEIPEGKYFLEVPMKPKRKIYHLVEVTGKMFARTPAGRALDGSPGAPADLLVDYLIGDGVPLENALYNLCSYRYERSIGQMREKDMEAVAKGKEPESGFKTALGVAQTMQEMVANLIGIAKVDFGLYKNLQKLESFLAGEKGRGTARILKIFEKSGLQKKLVDFNGQDPNIDGLLVFVEDDDKKLKRLSGLGIIEKNYLEKYREALNKKELSVTIGGKKRSASVEQISRGVELVGTVFSLIGNIIETYEMLAAFQASWSAWEHMGEELGRIARRINRVAAKDQPWALHGHGQGWFTYGDLVILENLKMAADNAAAEAQEAGWAWCFKMSAELLGFCKFGELFGETLKEIKDAGGTAGKMVKAGEKAKKYYGVARTFAEYADKLTHANVIDIYTTQIKEKWHDLNAWVANEVALMHHAIGMSAPYWDAQNIALQFYLRAKVLYGLKRLIDMCGPLGNTERRLSKYNFIEHWLTPGKTFEQAVDELRVQDYIRDLCLSERFWVRKDHLTVDWLHHWLQEKDQEHKNQVLTTTEPATNRGDWFTVEFQRYWPIHFMEHDVKKFAERFSTDWSSVDDDDVETCFLQRGRAKWEPVPGSTTGAKMLKITEWVNLNDRDVIDSETPVRAVLVFKKGAKVRVGCPVTFQVERTDLLNVPGPVYQTVVRPLVTPGAIEGSGIEEDKSLEKYKDQLGAIVSFSYSYVWKKGKKEEPAKIYHGLKPLIETPRWEDAAASLGFKYYYQWARNIQEWIKPQAMDMAVKYTVGDGHATGYAVIKGRFWDSATEVTVQPDLITGPPDPEFTERNRAKFTDLEFLRRQVPESSPPKPVYPKPERVVLQYTDDDGATWKEVNGRDGITVRNPVRIVFVFKEKVETIPVVARIERTDGSNVRGPYYTANVANRLDKLGPQFAGKWGVVITPEYYMFEWRVSGGSMKVEVLNGGEMWRGIKPVTAAETYWQDLTADAWKDYTFTVYYGVGTNDPNQATDRVDVVGSALDDVPLKFEDFEAGLSGAGIYGVGKKDKILFRGKYLSVCTMPFIAFVVNAEDETMKRYVSGDRMHQFLEAVDDMPNLYNVVNLSY
jgi:hypothetical protein